MFEGGLAAIDKVLEETGQKSLHLVSYCVGGTMAGTLMAWLGKHNDKRVASATFFTAQLDFEDAGELQIFVDEHILEVVGEDMEKGYMPADRMANAFNMLRANDLIWGYMVSNYMLGKDPFPFDLLYWNADSTAMPARAHRFYLEEFYIRERLRQGRAHGRRHADHARRHQGAGLPRGDQGGPHRPGGLGLSRRQGDDAGPRCASCCPARGISPAWSTRRCCRSTSSGPTPTCRPPTLEDWLKGAEETPGSWWPDWDAWLKRALGPAGAGARAGREARRDRAGARVLRQGALRRGAERARVPAAAGTRRRVRSRALLHRGELADRQQAGPASTVIPGLHGRSCASAWSLERRCHARRDRAVASGAAGSWWRRPAPGSPCSAAASVAGRIIVFISFERDMSCPYHGPAGDRHRRRTGVRVWTSVKGIWIGRASPRRSRDSCRDRPRQTDAPQAGRAQRPG